MEFVKRRAEKEEDWDFFFSLSFETLKLLRKSSYDRLVSDNPDKSDNELFGAHRKEMEEFSDFENSTTRVFIVLNDDEYCGYLWMGERNSMDYWDFQKPQWVYDVVVVQKFRGKGLGKKLMGEAEKFAHEMSRDIGLLVYEDNTHAINLYKKEGYSIKCIPMSRKFAENILEELIEGYAIREARDDDTLSIQQLGLASYRNMVKFSKDIPDDQILVKYDEYQEKIDKMEKTHCTFVAETDDGEVCGFITVGVAGFSDEVGVAYDFAIDSVHRDAGVEKALISRFESWASSNGLSHVYYLLHSNDDVSQEFLQTRDYSFPGVFMEKDLTRGI